VREIVGNFLKTLLTSKKTIVLTGAGVSNTYGQWKRTKSAEMAKKSVWAKVIAYN